MRRGFLYFPTDADQLFGVQFLNKILWPHDPNDMQKAYHSVLIGGQRPVVGIVTVGGDQDVFRCNRIPHRHHNGRVLVLLSFERQLD